MPAAAVIPAPVAYIKVVAVKKLVVGSRVSPARGLAGLVASAACVALPSAPNRRGGSRRPLAGGGPCPLPRGRAVAGALSWVARGTRPFYFEKIRVFKAGFRRPE